MAHQLARELNVECQLVVVNNAREVVRALEAEQADIGFLAVDPSRSEHMSFTKPYLLIEGCYLVKEDSLLTEPSQVDQAGHRVVVGLGSAYDLHLSRHLQHAELVRAESSKAVVSAFLQGSHEVAAGVKHQLETDAASHGQLRLLPGAFMTIQQAMACPKSRGAQAHLYLDGFVQNLKQRGFIKEAMHAHGVTGASLAP